MTDPLTPPDCDLRGYEYMPLFGQKLFGSSFYSLALQNPRAGLAGQKLWWEAWQQCPAGSLPVDDLTLCRMADFGADLKAWSRAKDVALHGFILCSDGRLYHPLLCREAIWAYGRRLKERARKAKYRKRHDADCDGQDADVPRDTTRTERDQDEGRDATSDCTGQDRTGTEEEDPPKPPQGGARRRRSQPRFRNGMAAIAHFMDQGLTLDEAIEEAKGAGTH